MKIRSHLLVKDYEQMYNLCVCLSDRHTVHIALGWGAGPEQHTKLLCFIGHWNLSWFDSSSFYFSRVLLIINKITPPGGKKKSSFMCIERHGILVEFGQYL